MPGDIRSPEFLFPFHYDNRYEPGGTVFNPGSPKLKSTLKEIVEQEFKRGITPEALQKLTGYIIDNGYECRNWGDESFRKAVVDFIKKHEIARKVARKCLT